MNLIYEKTIEKLTSSISILEDAFTSGKLESAIPTVKLFKDYINCFYCQGYRKLLEGHENGCCKTCPLHKYGEKKIGRTLAWNGCYKIPPYREMVRLSWQYCEAPNPQIALALIQAMKDSRKELQDNERIA